MKMTTRRMTRQKGDRPDSASAGLPLSQRPTFTFEVDVTIRKKSCVLWRYGCCALEGNWGRQGLAIHQRLGLGLKSLSLQGLCANRQKAGATEENKVLLCSQFWSTKVRKQSVEVEMMPGPKPQTPNPKPQTPNPKPQTPNPKPQTPNPKPQTPNPKPQTPNPKPQTPNPKPQTPNPKPQTPNPKPQTPNPKPQTPNPKPQTPNPKPQTPNPKPQTPNPKPQTLNPKP